MKHFLITLILTSSSLVIAEEGGHKDRVGPGKAVLEASEQQGIKLSDKALNSLKLKLQPVAGSELSIPKNALIRFQDFLAVYRLRDGWFRLVEIEPKLYGNQATITSKELKTGDQIVVHNGGLLRVVELDIFGPEADACAD